MIRSLLRGMLLASALAVAGTVGAAPAQDPDEGAGLRTRYLLVGPDGGAVTTEDFRGRLQLIAFGYTACPDVCPTTLVEMAEVLRLLGDDAEGLQGLFVSVDPERDTPASLKTYTAFFDPRIIGLSGSPELVQRAARNFRVRYAKVPGTEGQSGFYAVDHSAGLYLLGRDGGFIKKFAYGTPPARIASEIQAAMHAR